MYKSYIYHICIIGLVGCSGGSYTITISEIDSKMNELSGESNSFPGHYFKKVEVVIELISRFIHSKTRDSYSRSKMDLGEFYKFVRNQSISIRIFSD